MYKKCFTQQYIDAGMPGWPSDRGLFEAMSDLPLDAEASPQCDRAGQKHGPSEMSDSRRQKSRSVRRKRNIARQID
jgi:hypothetical protein